MKKRHWAQIVIILLWNCGILWKILLKYRENEVIIKNGYFGVYK
jgi:hypothetical protein